MGISVEKLNLDGQGQSINGIVNQNAGDLSYVDHVNLYQILGTGLLISGGASNSGPYSNITFDTGVLGGNSSTVCVQLSGLTGTHGIRGLTCHAETHDPNAAILLDSSNNSIKDVTITGFFDGIVVGSNAAAQSNVLMNINGTTKNPCGATCPTPITEIHVSSNNTVNNLAIMGASNSGGPGTNTIQDDMTTTTLEDPYVAMYVLGKSQGSGHPRFTTSPNTASWSVGPAAPTGSCASSAGGSLFSNTGASITGFALWFCPVGGGSWTHIQ
jgi:hypothetical protein